MKTYDYDRFEAHPIKETDIMVTRDPYLFECIFEDYERAVCAKLRDYRHNSHIVNRVLNGYIDTLQKIQAFERMSGLELISYTDSRGRLRQNPSYQRRLSRYL